MMRVLLLSLVFVSSGLSFNVEVEDRDKITIYTPATGGRGESWFGYDVDMYKNTQGKVGVLVGAPRHPAPLRRNGGQAFWCDIDPSRCAPILSLDTRGNTPGLNGTVNGRPSFYDTDEKAGEWLGHSVMSSKTGDLIMVCAPQYKYRFTDNSGRYPNPNAGMSPGIEPVGRCILAEGPSGDFQPIHTFAPSTEKHDNWGYHRWGYGMMGFSAAISGQEDKLFMSAPGAYYWHGGLYVQNAENERDFERTREAGTNAKNPLDDNYIGYSTAAGDFDGDGIDDVVVGAPRGNNDTGMIVVYSYASERSSPIRNMRNITGKQVGAYFGASVAASDIDGDGLDDLIIGSPMYSMIEKSKNGAARKWNREVGSVTVYFQGRNHGFDKSTQLVGTKEWARFGFDVAAAGDLNGDGYNDIVVGAPYDWSETDFKKNPRRNGAIYIFHGKEGGIIEEPAQVIYAEQVKPGLKTFGFSVAGGTDVDDNKYPDLLIGAYGSDTAVVLRTRPVVSVSGSIELEDAKVIDLERKRCPINGRDHTCATFKLCMSYAGVHIPNTLVLKVKITLDARKSAAGRRAMWVDHLMNNEQTIRLAKKAEDCTSYEFYVKDTVDDKLNPILIQANYTLIQRSFGKELPAIKDAHKPASIEKDIKLKTACSSASGDEICYSDLQLTAHANKEELMISKDDRLTLEVTVANKKDAAYDAKFNVSVPPGLEYIGAKRSDHRPGIDGSDSSFPCEVPYQFHKKDSLEPYVISCRLGNPLHTDKTAAFSIEFSSKAIDIETKTVVLNMTVFTSSNETNPEDNQKVIEIPMTIATNLNIIAESFPLKVNYDETMWRDDIKYDKDIGPPVTHIYEFINKGPSDFGPMKVDIYWPSFTQESSDGKPRHNLLYLFGDPIIEDNSNNKEKTRCEIAEQHHINIDSLTILTNREPEQPSGLRAFISRNRRQTRDEEQSATVAKTFRNLVNKIKEYSDDEKDIDFSAALRKIRVDCSEMACTKITCYIPGLKSYMRTVIKIPSFLWINTLIQEAFYDARISSVAIAKVLDLPFKFPEDTQLPIKSAIATTVIDASDSRTVKRGVPFWLILIAILAGLTFLILLILLLWKLGFFKRTRPPRGQALVTKPPESEYYGYTGTNTGYAPASMYSEAQYGQKL